MKLLRGVMTEATTSLALMRLQFQQARMLLQLLQQVQLELRPLHLRKVKAEELLHQLLVGRLMERMDTGTHSSNFRLLTMSSLTIMPQ